jgi:hypothetical protein
MVQKPKFKGQSCSLVSGKPAIAGETDVRIFSPINACYRLFPANRQKGASQNKSSKLQVQIRWFTLVRITV